MLSVKQKLIKQGVDPSVADKLVVANVLTPKQIKKMSKTALKKIGLKDSEAKTLKEKFVGN